MQRQGAAPAIGRLFARQDGLATAAQLEALGATRAYVRTRIRNGEWIRVSRHVLASGATPDSWRRRVRAAWFDVGTDAAASHVTACRLHDLDGCSREEEVHLTVCGLHHRTSVVGAVVHRSTLLGEEDCDEVDGIGVVMRPVALIQLAATRGADRAGKALDGMLRRGDPAIWIGRVAQRWLRPGTSGAGTVLTLLDQRVNGRLPRSWFQRVARRVLESHGIALVDEHPVRDPESGRVLAELDLALPRLQIGVECQSWEWHGTPTAQAADARRRRRLRLLGWEIVDVWWTDLDRMDEIVAELRFLVDQRAVHASSH